MGLVYRATDLKLDRIVALKFLPSELMRDLEARERFVHEAKTASALDHHNICTIYEIGETEDERVYIAMAYYEGGSLKDKIEQGQVDQEKAIDLAVQIARGLAKAHEKGIVHRDIKPANIMITEDGVAKIVDFGLAKLSGQGRLTQTGTTMGTVAYMSPEQAKGEPVDHRTDIWSFGTLVYEMLSGRLPFKGEHEQSMMYSILNDEPLPLAKIVSGIPQELAQIVGMALRKIPDHRYKRMEELLDDLACLAKGLEPEYAKVRPLKSMLFGMKKIHFYGGLVVIAVIAIVVGMILSLNSGGSIDSIAVLPLKNLSGDPDQEFFAEGMHEALITELSKIKTLTVISKTSAMLYRDSEKSLPEIADELNVDVVVEGSAQHVEGKVRINIQLIDGESDRNIWGDKYDRDYKEVLKLHSEVAEAIAKEIRIALAPQDKAKMTDKRSVIPEAYEAFLKGNFQINKFSVESLEKGIELLKNAIDIDPNYAPAYTRLADAYMLSAISHGTQPRSEAFPKARAAVMRALEIDENLSSAYASLARLELFYYWDWEAGEKACQRAIELNPNNVEAYNAYSGFLMIKGYLEEALSERRKAQRLDPLNLINNADVGVSLIDVGKYDEAIKQLQDVLEMNPNFTPAMWAMGEAYRHQQMYQEAIDWFKKAFTSSGEHSAWLGPLGLAYAEAGMEEQAREVLDRLKKLYVDGHNVSPTVIAAIHDELDEKEKALEWLEEAIEIHDAQVPYYKLYRIFSGMQSDPRFISLMESIGLK
ncbi:MAG: protein kinase [Candidatus Aminicenantes bacterium]|nr:MAG: protein kinase [Candidatus Aminicenantes bacterium]